MQGPLPSNHAKTGPPNRSKLLLSCGAIRLLSSIINLNSQFYATSLKFHPLSKHTVRSKKHFSTLQTNMDIDDNDDDFYAPEEPTVSASAEAPQDGAPAATETAPAEAKPDADEDLEEGEEEDEGGAMDEDDSSDDVMTNRPILQRAQANVSTQSMVIITERKDGTSAAPPS